MRNLSDGTEKLISSNKLSNDSPLSINRTGNDNEDNENDNGYESWADIVRRRRSRFSLDLTQTASYGATY